jgi:hypothetical protein
MDKGAAVSLGIGLSDDSCIVCGVLTGSGAVILILSHLASRFRTLSSIDLCNATIYSKLVSGSGSK